MGATCFCLALPVRSSINKGCKGTVYTHPVQAESRSETIPLTDSHQKWSSYGPGRIFPAGAMRDSICKQLDYFVTLRLRNDLMIFILHVLYYSSTKIAVH